MRYFIKLSAILIATVFFINTAHAEQYKLLIQPILSKQRTETFYKPLADYLSEATGHDIKVVGMSNFLAYWNAMRKGDEYQLILDAAHFTDFRIKRNNYNVLVKVYDTVTYSLVTSEDDLLFDPEELNGKTIATVTSPSLGGVRLFELYDNPLRQPIIRETTNFVDALRLLKEKKTFAALVPTPLINGDTTVNTMLTTDPVPHMALSASSSVDEITQRKITQALLSAGDTPEGLDLLQRLNLKGFEATDASTYDGHSELLADVFGY
ncbi:MAG: PhnD/SsuA/transferrin family substrate-binding protein [Sulfuriflexus sp.]|nr:PhnD/SsuA/transferrin family substrate-binding protein [Sulfuriflexus sp.]